MLGEPDFRHSSMHANVSSMQIIMSDSRRMQSLEPRKNAETDRLRVRWRNWSFEKIEQVWAFQEFHNNCVPFISGLRMGKHADVMDLHYVGMGQLLLARQRSSSRRGPCEHPSTTLSSADRLAPPRPPAGRNSRFEILERAPVNAPFTCPKNALSNSSRGTAAQLTLMSGCPAREFRAWSSPVPDSPLMSTLACVGTISTCSWSIRRSRSEGGSVREGGKTEARRGRGSWTGGNVRR